LFQIFNQPCPRLAWTVAVSVPAAVLQLREEALMPDGFRAVEEAQLNEKVGQGTGSPRLFVLQRLVSIIPSIREVV